MPVDQNGNRAEIVMDPNSTIARMNIGRLYEQYINSASRDVRFKIIHDLGVNAEDRHLKAALEKINVENNHLIQKSWDYLIGFYKIVSPRMYRWFTDGKYNGDKLTHLGSIIKEWVYLYLPTDNEAEPTTIVTELEQFYRPTYGPVTYVGNSGNTVTTVDPIRIGSMYMVLLEKTGDDWTAVSSGKLQHFGVLSQVTNSDKYSQPSRKQAIRAMGESEVRIYVSYAGPEITEDIMDRNNNPTVHKEILRNILDSDAPTALLNVIDRKKFPLGNSKPLNLLFHLGVISGWRFIYRKHIPNYKPL